MTTELVNPVELATDIQLAKPISFSGGYSALWNFYTEENPRTKKARWQHMDAVRMIEIMNTIASSPEAGEGVRKKAKKWLAKNGQA